MPNTDILSRRPRCTRFAIHNVQGKPNTICRIGDAVVPHCIAALSLLNVNAQLYQFSMHADTSRPPSSTRLPLELCLCVIDALGRDLEPEYPRSRWPEEKAQLALRQCALVCSTWRARAQTCLFIAVGIRSLAALLMTAMEGTPS